MTTTDCFLTPAQVDFVKSLIGVETLDKWTIESAGKAASQRYFTRISQGTESYILIVWDSRDPDWDRFLGIADCLKEQVSFLPKIYGYDSAHGLILEEDLGDLTLKKYCIENSANSQKVVSVYKNVLKAMYRWHSLDVSSCTSVYPRMDNEIFLWETAYFAKNCVQDYFGFENLLDQRWDNERQLLAVQASSQPLGFIHRDFQSENIIVQNNDIRFVDFQGARNGPVHYDAASLLFDPYVKLLSEDVIDELFSFYSDLYANVNKRDFLICASQRLMQALGAYGNLCLHKGKEWYRDYIPITLQRLHAVLEQLDDFGHIKKIVESCKNSLITK